MRHLLKKFKLAMNTNTTNVDINDVDCKSFLKKYIDRPFIYIPNPGNAGDKLIAYGTYQAFNDLGLEFTVGEFHHEYENQLLVYGGGGNLVGTYGNCRNFLLKNKDRNKILVLPHTIREEQELLASLDDNVTLMCREAVSYDYVKSVVKYPENVYISHDMAFYSHIPAHYLNREGYGVCNAYRNDPEMTFSELPKNNIDLSSWLDKQGLSESDVDTVANQLFDYISNYATVNTNRLHIAIAGTLLGKEVNFFGNNYYKNFAVYERSLAERSSVTFRDNSFFNEEIGDDKNVALRRQEVDALKDAAVSISESNPALAYKLLFIASRARRGPVILNKLKELSDKF
tara:strand:+ start:1238 stop:2266 length:1029 start_codon:yes stop_codon:yes gene_type:complete